MIYNDILPNDAAAKHNGVLWTPGDAKKIQSEYSVAYNVLLGMPGAGKSLHIDFINYCFGGRLEIIGTGEIIRIELDNPASKWPPQVRELIRKTVNSGGLIDDHMVASIARSKMQFKNTVFDGFPRNKEQARIFLNLVRVLSDIYGGQIKPAVYMLNIDEELARARVLGRKDGRTDDTPAAFARRMRVWYEQTLPLADFFAQQNVPILGLDANKDVKKPGIGQNERKMEIFDFIRTNLFTHLSFQNHR